ncbi:hypothetical protein K1719_021238 [Acacia pycnantha]|nr:hypothetical protein K1719_021238 [Acacia pycnantha]
MLIKVMKTKTHFVRIVENLLGSEWAKAELEELEKWIRRLSKGEIANEVEVEASKGVTLVKLDKGFVLCDFIVHNGVSDESGKWHEGAMMTLMDAISSWVAFSLTSLHHITVSLSLSFYSNIYLQEVVKGIAANEVDVEANKDVTLVKLDKGFVLCNFIVHNGVSDESGKWHEGAMVTLMDVVGSWAAFSLTSLHQITEVVEIEAKASGKKGRMTSVTVEVRNKHHRRPLAMGVMWMAPSSSNNNKPIPSRL